RGAQRGAFFTGREAGIVYVQEPGHARVAGDGLCRGEYRAAAVQWISGMAFLECRAPVQARGAQEAVASGHGLDAGDGFSAGCVGIEAAGAVQDLRGHRAAFASAGRNMMRGLPIVSPLTATPAHAK